MFKLTIQKMELFSAVLYINFLWRAVKNAVVLQFLHIVVVK